MNDPNPSPEPKRAWFEPVVAILMGATTLTTAWCSYQSARWSGLGGDLSSRADGLERDAAAMHLESQQVPTVQQHFATQAINAHLQGNEKSARFYSDRMGSELKPAWEKWIATRPFDDPNAPLHPFVSSFYKPRFEDEIREARIEAEQAKIRARSGSGTASAYLRLTVMLAIVLFFAGMAGTFDQRRIRTGSLAFALTLLSYAVVCVLLLPVT